MVSAKVVSSKTGCGSGDHYRRDKIEQNAGVLPIKQRSLSIRAIPPAR
jgi:hypothetical protein